MGTVGTWKVADMDSYITIKYGNRWWDSALSMSLLQCAWAQNVWVSISESKNVYMHKNRIKTTHRFSFIRKEFFIRNSFQSNGKCLLLLECSELFIGHDSSSSTQISATRNMVAQQCTSTQQDVCNFLPKKVVSCSILACIYLIWFHTISETEIDDIRKAF